jgi:hypothetical protein
LKGSKEE